MFFDIKILTSVLGCVLYLYYSKVDVKDRTINLETPIHNVSLEEAYDFLMNPDGFERWFRWIPRAYQADQRQVGVGKKYIIEFVSSPIVFETKQLVVHKDEIKATFESEAILKPKFSIHLYRTCKNLNYHRIKVKITLIFDIDSCLFRYPTGIFLQSIARSKIKEALINLEYVFIRLHRNKNRIL